MERVSQKSGEPPGTGAFLSIDESGDFSYHPSVQALLEGYEYVGEAACILDRDGTQYRLVLDKDRRLCLGPQLGQVDLNWLRRTWVTALKTHATAHRLRRHLPADLDSLPAELFDTLALEQGISPQGGEWILEAGGRTERLPTLADTDRRAAALHEHDGLRVEDPYGRSYRLEWPHPHLAPGRPFYVEV